jgi:hypothetical protein
VFGTAEMPLRTRGVEMSTYQAFLQSSAFFVSFLVVLLVENPVTIVNDGVATLMANIRYFFFAVVVALVVQPVVRQLT